MMSVQADHRDSKISIYVPNGCLGMSLHLILDLCWTASQYVAETSREKPNNRVQVISSNGESVETQSGQYVRVDAGVNALLESNTVFITAFSHPVKQVLAENKKFINLLPQLHNEKIALAAVSNATFLLAEAGLLDGKLATLYPPTASAFKQHYPQVDLQIERAITHCDNIYCANGIASGCDLIVTLIEKIYGPEIAERISKEFLIGFNRSYQIADTAFDGQKYHQDSNILAAQHWLEEHFAQSISIQTLASEQGMSPRNFSRRFKQATGESATQYLQRLRIEKAKELLRTTSQPIAEIAYQVGFSDLSYFSRQFIQFQGDTPNGFRNRFKLSGE